MRLISLKPGADSRCPQHAPGAEWVNWRPQSRAHASPSRHLISNDHGRNRIERREVKVFDAKPLLGEEGLWHETLACVVQVHRWTDKFNTREGQWVPSEETAYYVSTCRRDAESLAVAIRGHWGVENRNHYVRDVAMKEDASRIRRNPTIFARLGSFALNILRKNRIVNVSEALYDNALNLNNVLQFEGVL